MDILDNSQALSQRDPQNALGIALNQYDYFAVTFDAAFEPKGAVENIVWAGMGGSALPMVVVESWPQLKIPFEVVRNYTIPPYVNERTLFVASSYSGNTEETLEALSHAEAAGAQIVVVAAGGKLADHGMGGRVVRVFAFFTHCSSVSACMYRRRFGAYVVPQGPRQPSASPVSHCASSTWPFFIAKPGVWQSLQPAMAMT
jgi:hypothetical protein